MVITRAGLNVAGGVNVVTGPLSLVTTAQVVSSGASPSISAESGLGTGPTVSISGSDLAGTITVTPGSGPTVGNIVYIGFNGARAAAPAAVVLGPSNNTAAALSFNVYADTKSTVGFQVTSIGVLTAGTQYKWDYMVLG